MGIVLLGKTGDGKSSCGNTILGDSSGTKFLAKCASISVTRNCEVQRGHGMGSQTQIEIIDTPGFSDTSLSDEELKPEIVKCITTCAPGPHAFIIVLRVGRYTHQEMATVAKITRSFGECAFPYTVVLFTHGDDLDEGQTIEQFVEESEDLKELVEKCGGRYHMIDNKRWNQEHEYKNNRVQVKNLLNTIEEMVRQNGGGYYTNEMLQAVEEAIQREEEKVRKENPNEIDESKIREIAIQRFTEKLFAKCAGVATGALLGAFLGFGTKAAQGGLAAGVAGAVGAISGGIVGFKAVGDGDTILDAVNKASSVVSKMLETTTTNEGHNTKKNE